jgi:hypothetical protein
MPRIIERWRCPNCDSNNDMDDYACAYCEYHSDAMLIIRDSCVAPMIDTPFKGPKEIV